MRHRSLFAFAAAGSLVVLGLGSPARAAFPGSNGRIAFGHEEPAGDHTQVDVYTVKPDGTGVLQLTATPGSNEFSPQWNAAGTRIAFWRTRAPFGPGNVWVMDADGSNARRLTANVDARDPTWNPAGTRLVYTRRIDDLFSLRVSDGDDRRQLTSGPAHDFEPAWSPGGRQIAFTRGFDEGDVGDIYVLDLDTHEITQVTDSKDYDHQVAWAPDGSKLLFERDFDNTAGIFVVNPDGTRLQRLTKGPHFDTGPASSPTGKKIVFSTDRQSDFFPHLWVMKADGTDLHLLYGTQFAESTPDWQPV